MKIVNDSQPLFLQKNSALDVGLDSKYTSVLIYCCSSLSIRNIFFDLISLVDDRIQPLAMTVKRWAKERSINDASQGTLSSYSLMLMVLHFLQSKKKYSNRIMDPFVLR